MDGVLSIVEYVLFAALTLFVGCGFADQVHAFAGPLIYGVASGAVLLCVALIARAHFVNQLYRITLKNALGLAAIALAGYHLSGVNAQAGMPLLYYAVIVAAGALGEIHSVVVLVILFTFGELGALFVPAIAGSGLDATVLSPILEKCVPLAQSAALLVVAGVLPWFAGQRRETSRALTGPQNVPAPPPAQGPALSERCAIGASQENPASKTQMFTVEYMTELMNQGQVDELLASVVYFMSRNFKAYSALGFVYEPTRQVFMLNSFHSKSLAIVKGAEFQLGKGIIGRIATEKRSFMSGDISLYSSEIGYYGNNETVNSILAVPIISEEHELLGVLVIDSKEKNSFKDQDKETLKRFSYLAAALITNARMRLFQERAAHTFQIFYKASHQLTTAMNFDGVFDVLFRVVPSVVPVTRIMSILFDVDRHTGVVHQVAGESPDVPQGAEFPINSGLYSYAFQNRRVVSIPDYQAYESKYYRFVPDEMRNPSIRSLIIFPITDDEHRCPGLFSVESDQPERFAGEVEQTLATLVDNASVAFTRALLYQRMEKLATTDGLTELNNHRHFQELLANEIERSRRYTRPLSLLLLDIDHFKTFNDTYGHPVGDLVLKEIAACIRSSIRINDIAARYGGEEFTVIIPETGDRGALVIAQRIRATIEAHVVKSLEKELKVTVSIGCASIPPLPYAQAELIDSADKALYYSKEHGRNRVTLFVAGMTSGNTPKKESA